MPLFAPWRGRSWYCGVLLQGSLVPESQMWMRQKTPSIGSHFRLMWHVSDSGTYVWTEKWRHRYTTTLSPSFRLCPVVNWVWEEWKFCWFLSHSHIGLMFLCKYTPFSFYLVFPLQTWFCLHHARCLTKPLPKTMTLIPELILMKVESPIQTEQIFRTTGIGSPRLHLCTSKHWRQPGTLTEPNRDCHDPGLYTRRKLSSFIMCHQEASPEPRKYK